MSILLVSLHVSCSRDLTTLPSLPLGGGRCCCRRGGCTSCIRHRRGFVLSRELIRGGLRALRFSIRDIGIGYSTGKSLQIFSSSRPCDHEAHRHEIRDAVCGCQVNGQMATDPEM